MKLNQQKLSDLTIAFRNAGFARKNITPVIAITKDGKRAEVYFNPVTGAVVQNNVD